MNVFIYFFLSIDDNTSVFSIEDIKKKEAFYYMCPYLCPVALI